MNPREPKPEEVAALALECAKAAGACREAKQALAEAEKVRRVERDRLDKIVTNAEAAERAALKRSRELTSLLGRVAGCQATVTATTCSAGGEKSQTILTFSVRASYVDPSEPKEVRIDFGEPVPWNRAAGEAR